MSVIDMDHEKLLAAYRKTQSAFISNEISDAAASLRSGLYAAVKHRLGVAKLAYDELVIFDTENDVLKGKICKLETELKEASR